MYNYRPRHSAPPKPVKRSRHLLAKFIVIVILICAAGFAFHMISGHGPKPATVATTNHTTKPATTPKPANPCAGNTLDQEILVSISKQHLWACNGTNSLYDSAVVTGMEQYPADLTPPGTYHIYSKQTDLYLNGHDSTGSWHDYVNYWMPFLDNQYGAYGLHDATWRDPSEFGKVNINAPYTAAVIGSHGCVELPLATAKWLYNWASVGTTVQINS